MKSPLRMAFLSLLLLSLDFFSKWLAISFLHPMVPSISTYPFGGIGIFPNFFGISFSLNYVVNSGAAWGLFQGHPVILFAIRSCFVLGFIAYLFLRKRSQGARTVSCSQIALWLVAVGALGNLIDYLLYGHVIDFFHFVFWGYSFPIFNFADVYISLGAAILFLFSRGSKANEPSRSVV